MNQPTLRPAVVPDRPRPAGFRAACLALLSWCVLPAALVLADPIAPTTIGFDSISGPIGNYYNGGEGPNVGIESTFPAAGGWLDELSNPTLNVPSGFTTGFAVVWNVRDGMRIRIFDGLDGSGTQLATQDFFGISGTASLAFTGTAKSVRLERFGQPDFLGYDNLTFGSTTIGTPVSEPPAVTTSAATGVTSATATLNATINPAGTATTAQFEYGTTPSYGSTASVTLSPNDGTSAQTVSANLSGLAASTTYYYRATAVNGVGPRNGSGLTFTTAAPPGQALHFDGIDDKVTIPHRAELNSLPLTVECWFKPTAAGSGVSSIVNKYVASSGNGWAIHYAGGQVSGWYYAQPGFVNTTLPGVTVSLNTWHHVALVVETTGSKLYVDGVLASSAVWAGVPTVATTTQNVTLGEYVGNASGGKFFPGAIDEVRIWNGARSLAEIQAFKDTEITSMPSCLIAYYKFSQGLADGVNPGVTALPDIANAFADNGTLANFALTGTTGNWTTGPTLTAATSTYAAAPDINLVGNGNPILDGTTATATGNNTDFGSSLVGTGVPKTFTLENTGTSALTVSALSFSGANPGDYAVSGITLPATVAANDSTTFTVTFTPSAGGSRTATINVVNDDCDESNYDFALIGSGTLPPATALHFDGNNDHVSVPHSGNLPLTTPFTVESWIYVEATSEPFPTIVSKNSDNLVLWLQEGTASHQWRLCARLGGTQVTAPAANIAENTWTHVAMTYDGTIAYLYKDGVLLTSGAVAGPTLNTSPFLIGLWENSGRPFRGKMDELRVWTGARSAIELQAMMNTELAIMPSCLVAYFKFNQGVANSANPGETTALNLTGGPNGTLNNFALTGPTSNWTTGSGITETASVLDLTAPEINLVGNGQNIALGDYVPGTADDTDFGSALVGGSVIRTFTVQNVGSGTLNVSAIPSSGTHAANFTVGALTPAGPIAGGGSATFTVTFAPSATGLRSATITVQNDDCNEAFYAFAVQGTGVNNPPTVVAANGTVTVNEGTTAFNGITFSDPEGNSVTLTASLGTVSAGGGTSAFAGYDLTTAGQWRTASVVKSKDLDGDNVYGTDGYAMWGLNGVETVVNPAYATITRNPSLSFYPGDANYKTIDDPANPSGPQKVTGVLYNIPGGAVPTVFYTLTFTQARRVRMGILVDNSNVPAVSPATLRLRQTAGGTYDSGHVAAGDGTSRNQTVDYYFFDIAAQAGDVFEISGINDVGFLSNGIGGMFLDTAGWTYATLDGPAGPTTVTITATDSLGASGQTTFTLNVNNVAPTIALTGNPTVPNGSLYTLNLGAITDPGTDTVSAYSINWGDGNTENFTGNPASTSKTHTYASVGNKNISVALTDEDGTHAGAGTKTVTVENTAPTVTATSPTITVNEGTATSNALTVNDPESDSVTVTASVGSIGVLASATYVSEFATTTTPRRFDFDSAGNIYVGNLAGVVTKYDPSGNQLMQFTLASPGVFNDSENFTGIDVDAAGNIYVSYSGHTHTRKYDSTGNLIGNFGPATQQVFIRGGRFGGPSGNYYQLDRSHKLVLVSPSGTELWRTAGYNAGVNEPPNTGLNGNVDVAIHPTTGAAYVGDFGFIKGFDVTGATTGYFNTGVGLNNSIDMDAQGNLWAANATTIRKYTTAGIALGSFGTAGTGAGQFQLVTYLRFDAAGNLWALDQTRNKLIKFNVGQSSYAWLHTPADGPAGPTTVTITATDSLGASGQTTFTLNVNNVAPTATFSRSAATANENTVTPPSVSFTGQVDPGTTDVSTGPKYSYDYNNDGTWDDGDGTYAGSLTAATKTIPASYFASPAPASLTVKGRILDKDGGLTDYTVNITINHAPTAINGPLTIVEDFDYGTSAGTLSGNGGAGFSTAWNGGSYTPTGLTFSSLTSPGGAWNGSSGSRNFAATLAAAGPITGDFLFKRPVAGPVQMFGLGGFNNQGYTIALAPSNDSNGGTVPVVGLQGGGFANITPGALDPNTTYMYRFAYAGSSITVWILSAAQYDNFAPGGLTDAELNAASIGTGATQVTGRVTNAGNVTGNMANLFTYTFGGSGVTMDRLRMTGQPVGASLVVAENAAVNSSVGTLTPSDADSGNTFTFALVSGTGDADNTSFNISGSTLRSSAVFNYEVRNSYSIRVRVTDQGGLSYETPLTVTISNINEAVTDVALSPSSIAENNAPNATVGTLSATDGDTGDTHTFTLVGGAGSGDNGNFTIAANALKLTPSADFETKPSYLLRVRATDAGGLFFEKALTVTITDVAENVAPTVARDAASVTVPEGTTAFNSGTFADANSDTVTITASAGTITQSGAGTWTHQQTLTQGGNPIELVLDSQENLYVANSSQNTIYKYSAAGSLVTSWTVTGNPTGVAVDSANGWLYVALKSGHRIDKFTLSGTLLTSWGSAGSGDGQFNLPHCVAVDASGDVYVSDSFNSRIQVFSSTGTFLRKWGSSGSGNGQFNFPQGLRISPGGTLYVADRSNHRVQYFDTAGTFLGKWGSAGSGNGQFNDPAGIGIDPGGNVVVGDIFNNRIQKFTATGTFVDKLGPATAAGNLALPHGTAFPPSGRSVYIADHNNGRVVKFATPGGWNWSYTPADGAAGPTTVTITATDNGSPNLSSTTTFTLNVNNLAPTIALTGNATVANGTPYTLNLGAITDPGTDTVSAYSIDWGDGNTENFTGNPASTAKTHTYATLGAKTITVTLTDEDGTFTGGTKTITVENAAPAAAVDGLNRPDTTKVAKVLKSDLLGNDIDADGDPLTLTAVGNALPAGATVAIAGNFVVYTAPANNAGNGSFTYTLSDGTHSVTGTVTVTETSTSGGGGGTPNYLTLVPSGDDFVVTFLGVPGGSFRVQYTTSTAPPYVWNEFAPQAIYTAAPNGVFTHTDVNPPNLQRLYRAVSNP